MNGFLWAVLTACIWGIVPLMEKLGLTHTSPAVGVVARSLGVALVILGVALLRK